MSETVLGCQDVETKVKRSADHRGPPGEWQAARRVRLAAARMVVVMRGECGVFMAWFRRKFSGAVGWYERMGLGCGG